jgi:hypothetical protein
MNVQFTGSLSGSTPFPITIDWVPCPCTITLKSTAAGRKIELSTDFGVEYFTPPPDSSSSTTMQIVTVNSPVTHVRMTGQANDQWFINALGIS